MFRVLAALASFSASLSFANFPAENYDWLRSRVNEFWFNQVVGDCKERLAPLNIGEINLKPQAQCLRDPETVPSNNKVIKEVLSDLYFNEVLIESTKQNQCQFDFWNSLSTKASKATPAQSQANKKLIGQFESLRADLDVESQGAQKNKEAIKDPEAPTAQRKIVDQLVEAAYKIAKKEREIRNHMAQNPVLSSDPRKSSAQQINALAAELNVLETSYVFSEDQEVADFVKRDIVAKMNEAFKQGEEPNLEKLKQFFSEDPNEGFQSKVVERKLESIASEQQNYADIEGQYEGNYSFKVKAVQSGVGAKVLNDKLKQNVNFSHLQCQMESKYGTGEKISSAANTIVIAGVTLGFGGVSMALAKLSQIGMTSVRAARLAQALSTAVNSTISASEIAHGIVVSCREPHFSSKESTICERSRSAKEEGVYALIDSEIDHSSCLTDLGLAALSGFTAFKSAAKARQLKKEQQLVALGIKDKFSSLVSQIKADSGMDPKTKRELLTELNKAIRLSRSEAYPRKEFIAALAKDDAIDLAEALKQINGSGKDIGWGERVRNWISGKGLTKEEAEVMTDCLVEIPKKTSKCSLTQENSRS